MDIEQLIELRKALHRSAEIAGNELKTAKTIRLFFEQLAPSKTLLGLGGNGLAFVFESSNPGPTILFRADLDALPIPEGNQCSHASINPRISHKCGHDGHMAMLCGLASTLTKRPLKRGTLIALFQPAEETGEGAQLVLADRTYATLAPDCAVALHNLPGYPLGEVIVRPGSFASASVGMICELSGETSHAAQPEEGKSPTAAMTTLIDRLSMIPQRISTLSEPTKVTVVNAILGEAAFGTSPGEATVRATLRAHRTAALNKTKKHVEELISRIAKVDDLRCAVTWVEQFPETVNDATLVDQLITAARALKMPVRIPDAPFAWTEDFGHFTARYQGMFFGLGAGEDTPALHHPDYDFPDQLIPKGATLLRTLLDELTK